MTTTDPTAPAWVLDVAEKAVRMYRGYLSDAMLEQGEDITRHDLWRLRREQLETLLFSGKVLAVNHGSGYVSDKGQTARFADFYTARYDDMRSGGRALTVESDEPMDIRPVNPCKVIIKRA